MDTITTKMATAESLEGQIFKREYNDGDELYIKVLYADDEIVVSRSNKTRHSSPGHVHYFDRRSEFEAMFDYGRIEQTDKDVEIGEDTTIEFTSIAGIGDETASNLREAGFESAPDVRAASDDALLSIDGIGNLTLQRLRERVSG